MVFAEVIGYQETEWIHMDTYGYLRTHTDIPVMTTTTYLEKCKVDEDNVEWHLVIRRR